MKDEIHLKIGGDHGGKSFKACLQVCDTTAGNTQTFSATSRQKIIGQT